jgi:ATP-dependent RNA helicase RhlE
MNREQDERRRREDPNFQGAFHERKEYVKPGVTIDKRTGRTYVEGPNRSQKGNKARPSKGTASKPAVKAVKAAIARSKGKRK